MTSGDRAGRRRPGKDFEEQTSRRRLSVLHLAGGVAVHDGLPIVVDVCVLGAVGVSGATSADEDQELLELGVRAVADRPAATYISATDLAQKVAGPAGFSSTCRATRVDAGRRTGPGSVELHQDGTDVIRIEYGAATVDAGVTSYELGEDDVLVIPAACRTPSPAAATRCTTTSSRRWADHAAPAGRPELFPQ